MATPSASPSTSQRLHIGLYGATNAGKSTLMNALAGQSVALVSDLPGTTTDPVRKLMEFPGVGAALLIDTPGFEDLTDLGSERERLAAKTVGEVDIALVLCGQQSGRERDWIARFRAMNTPVVAILSQSDRVEYTSERISELRELSGGEPLVICAMNPADVERVYARVAQEALASHADAPTITGRLCKAGDVVVLVMPQDASAPQGRLILPQVQTIRELLDKHCVVLSVTPESFEAALEALKQPPTLIITDSQAFRQVYDLKPQGVPLTSFSILFAAFKGDAQVFREGAQRLGQLSPTARILIAEACTHAPQNEDIGRVKLPRLLRAKLGESLDIDIRAGKDFPDDLTPYDLVIHCGACMFNRKLVLSRLTLAQEQQVPITNYGMALAWLTGILDKVILP